MMAHVKNLVVPMPAMRTPLNSSIRSTVGIRSLGQMPSRRSPRSIISMMSWTRPMRSAMREISRMVASSDCRLTSTVRTTSSTRAMGGLRSSMIGALMPLSRKRRMFSKRDSAMPATPPRSMARATCGMPQVPLVTPNTLMPESAQRSTMVRALRSMRPRSMATCGPDIFIPCRPALAGRSRACGRRQGRPGICPSRRPWSSRHGRGRYRDRGFCNVPGR